MRNAMTVDVEDYFQVSAFEGVVDRACWGQTELRVERCVDRILTMLNAHEIKATFFTLGWIAKKCPAMVRQIAGEGHEIASHGWEHTRVCNQGPHEFREDIAKTKKFLEDTTGQAVNGYRAASYSLGIDTPWAHDILASEGYGYSSSVAPIKHDLYGNPDAPRHRYKVAGGHLWEVPITTIRLFGRNINCAGGGWFRLYPYWFSRWALQQVNREEERSALFYFHPWEIDAEQPRLGGLSAKTKFRHYLNLSINERRLQRLFSDLQWGRMDEVFFTEIERKSWQGFECPENLASVS